MRKDRSMSPFFRSINSANPKPPEEYLCSIYRCSDDIEGYAIYRWKTSGLDGEARPETLLFRFPAGEEYPHVTAFASIGSKIYMVGGLYLDRNLCSRHIFVVETEKLHTNDLAQIVRKVPFVLRAGVRRRNAVAIAGKIYTFPVHFGHAPESPVVSSRFEVFDPVTVTSNLLPEPPVRFSHYESNESYIATRRHIILFIKQRAGGRWIFSFDTAHPLHGWEDITPAQAQKFPFSLVPTLLSMQSATSFGGHADDRSRFLATVRSDSGLLYHAIFQFEDDHTRIGKQLTIKGIPGAMCGRSCFSHGGDVFFTYTDDARPQSGIAVWKFRKFSLAYRSDHDPDPNQPEDYYAAGQVFSFQLYNLNDLANIRGMLLSLVRSNELKDKQRGVWGDAYLPLSMSSQEMTSGNCICTSFFLK